MARERGARVDAGGAPRDAGSSPAVPTVNIPGEAVVAAKRADHEEGIRDGRSYHEVADHQVRRLVAGALGWMLSADAAPVCAGWTLVRQEDLRRVLPGLHHVREYLPPKAAAAYDRLSAAAEMPSGTTEPTDEDVRRCNACPAPASCSEFGRCPLDGPFGEGARRDDDH